MTWRAISDRPYFLVDRICAELTVSRDQAVISVDAEDHTGSIVMVEPGHSFRDSSSWCTCNRPISVYRSPRRTLTLCPQLCVGFNLAPAFPRGALTLCPHLCMGISPRRYTEIGLLPPSPFWVLTPSPSSSWPLVPLPAQRRHFQGITQVHFIGKAAQVKLEHN
jgi:hypothetical protein